MTRSVLYVAAPLRPTEAEIAEAVRETGCYRGEAPPVALRRNLDRAMRWLSWLRRSFPETTFIAPWICIVLSGDDDSDPAVRERAMRDNLAMIERCDGIVLCGPRISEWMRREMEHGISESGEVGYDCYDLTRWAVRLYGGDAPEDRPLGRTWRSMVELYLSEWRTAGHNPGHSPPGPTAPDPAGADSSSCAKGDSNPHGVTH